jgi:hypothetical protein
VKKQKQLGNHSMLDYFSFPMKRGRSKPTSSKKGRKKKMKNALNEDVNSNKPSVDDVKEVPKKILPRTNWSEGNNMIRLDGQFVMDVLRRRDRANDGVGIAGALEMFEQMRPDLSRIQITNAFAHTIRPRHKEDITNLRVTQQTTTTTKRSAITPEQQFRWHKM